jgi:hypothetical protein
MAEHDEFQAPLSLVDATSTRSPLPQYELKPQSVLLHVYNLSRSVVVANDLLSTEGIALGGAFHVGLEVYGSEYAYGVAGVAHLLPRAEEDHVYKCSVYLGETSLSHESFASLLAQACQKWRGADYDLLERNCCCFCSEVVQQLGVGPMPAWIDHFSRLLLSGRQLADYSIQSCLSALQRGRALLK